jgi:hypothetical protein
MFEYQGWATISESVSEADENGDMLSEIIRQIESKISMVQSEHFELGMKYFNAEPRLWVIGCSNRKRSDWDDVVKLFRFIAEISPGSYGILSFWDDEDVDGLSNIYQAYVLRRGALEKKIDPFLSPCIQTLRDD